jgi:CRP/FNR family cyclic AMP-dependent transcriptional regulator
VAVSDIAARLGEIPVFAGCTKKELAALAKVVRRVDHDAGEVIASEGEPGAGLFVIDAGEADVTVGGRRVNRLGPGDFFGEMALLDGGPRTATVTATTDVRMYALSSWVFRGLLSEHPQIAFRMLEVLAARLREATKSS